MTVANTMLNGRPNRHERRRQARMNRGRKDRVAKPVITKAAVDAFNREADEAS